MTETTRRARNGKKPAPKPRPAERLQFDESIGLDDPIPFPGWQPSLRQISAWCQVIREMRPPEPEPESEGV